MYENVIKGHRSNGVMYFHVFRVSFKAFRCPFVSQELCWRLAASEATCHRAKGRLGKGLRGRLLAQGSALWSLQRPGVGLKILKD